MQNIVTNVQFATINGLSRDTLPKWGRAYHGNAMTVTVIMKLPEFVSQELICLIVYCVTCGKYGTDPDFNVFA